MLRKLLTRAFAPRAGVDLGAAYAFLERNELDGARARADELLRAAPDDHAVRLFAARVAYREDRFERAVALLRETAARDDADIEALHLAAVCCVRAGRPGEALQPLGRALEREFGLAPGDHPGRLRALIELVWQAPLERWKHRLAAFSQHAWLLAHAGALRGAGPDLAAEVARRDPVSLAPARAEDAVYATLRLLDCRSGADPEWIEALVSRLMLPWMRRAVETGRFGLALLLETQAYGAYVVQSESESRFRHAFALWSDLMRAAGRAAGSQLAPLPPTARAGAPRIAFFLHSGALLAHTRALFEFLDALRMLEPRPLTPLVFHRGAASPELRARAAAAGAECRSLAAAAEDASSEDFAALLALRRHAAEGRIDAVVWVSVATHMAFAFAMRVAPVQIWWALKYHGLEFPEIDGYVTSGGAGSTKRIGARLWRSAPLAAGRWHDPALAPRAAEIRARHGRYELLFASIGREEKLNSEPFLAAVAEVLHACPRAGFLWTGRERLAAIEARLEAHGVAERCHHVGWVDTRLYAQVMDVFLDSFPFPCAFTLYEAMAAARPVVVYASAESAETGLHGMLSPLLAGEAGSAREQERARALFAAGPQPLYFCARSPAEYVAAAVRLARDPELRREAGEANRRFVAEFLSDRAAMARTLATHLVELVDAAAPRP